MKGVSIGLRNSEGIDLPQKRRVEVKRKDFVWDGKFWVINRDVVFKRPAQRPFGLVVQGIFYKKKDIKAKFDLKTSKDGPLGEDDTTIGFPAGTLRVPPTVYDSLFPLQKIKEANHAALPSQRDSSTPPAKE